MKILFANYRYFVSSGSERYLFNTSEALAARGHEIVPFSIHYRRNRPSQYAHYFVRPIGTPDEVFFRNHRRSPGAAWRTVERLFYSREVERAVARLAADTRPQIAYVLNYLRKLSPSLLVGLAAAGVPIVVRLSDYNMLCPQPHCLRDGAPCTLCIRGNLWASVRYRCVQGSLVASSMNAAATWYHRRRRWFDLIDVFVTPSRFMYDMMLSVGFPAARLRHIPSFVDTSAFRPGPDQDREEYIGYVGRIHPTKGIHLVLEALARMRRMRPARRVGFRLAGPCEPAYRRALQQKIEQADLADCVEFVGELDGGALCRFLGRARLTVMPSLWYENLPNAVLESYACGTPVVASDLGSLRECVVERETGCRFEPGNAAELARCLADLLDRPEELARMSRAARALAERTYAAGAHVERLEELFAELSRGHAVRANGTRRNTR